MRHAVHLLAFTIWIAACAILSPVSQEAVRQIAPTGKLRVGLYTGNPLSLVIDPATQERKGVAFDVGAAMARRLGVPYEPVVYPSVGALMEGMKTSAWDVTFIVYSPAREKELDFAESHVESELGYLVPSGSRIASIAEIDRPGVRIAVPARGQGDVILTASIKQASLVRVDGLAAGIEHLRGGKADAFAALKPSLYEVSTKLPGSRVLEGRFAAERVALAMPKGRPAALAFARSFIRESRTDGVVHSAIQKSGARGVAIP